MIGHVEPGPGNDGEALAAHRLARARADRIREALIADGLPPTSIASVWDWQFAVREPRVTLWVFSLAEGDDCDGKPIVQADAASTVMGPPAPKPPAPAVPAKPPKLRSIVEWEAKSPGVTETVLTRPSLAEMPAPVAIVAEAAAPPSSTIEKPAPLPSEKTAASSAEAALEALLAREPEAGQALASVPEAGLLPREPVPPEKASVSADPAPGGAALAITFGSNSSYFPKGTGRELKTLAA